MDAQGAAVIGRIGPDHQEANKLLVERDKIQYLVLLKKAADDASKDFSEAIMAVAEESGLIASVLRKFVVASAGTKFTDRKRECKQLSLLFEDIGK